MLPEASHHGAAPRSEARRAAGGAVEHAWRLYRRTFHAASRPLRRAEAEARHLHQIEREGEAAETPLIALLGLMLFLLPVFLVIVALTFVAYYVA